MAYRFGRSIEKLQLKISFMDGVALNNCTHFIVNAFYITFELDSRLI